MCAPVSGQAIEIRQVLERRDVALVEDAVRLEQRRLAVVDAGGVDADGLDGAVGDEPARGVGMETGKVQLRDRRLPALGRAQVARGVGPAVREAGAEKHDRVGGNPPCSRAPSAEVRRRDLIVGVLRAGPVHVDRRTRRRSAAPAESDRPTGALREMHRRVEMRAAVLGGEEVVGRVVVARRRHAIGHLVEPERSRRVGQKMVVVS